MSKTAAEIIVQTLFEAGVRRCRGLVGNTFNRVAREIEKPYIDWILMRPKKAGAVVASSGPGQPWEMCSVLRAPCSRAAAKMFWRGTRGSSPERCSR
jgi:hypothetical protein